MPLPETGSVPLLGEAGPSRQAFLIKFPEEILSGLLTSPGATVTVQADGGISLNIPDRDPITLDARPTSTPSEVHTLCNAKSNPSLVFSALATTRLNVPFTSDSTARAVDKMRAQNDELERQRRERAIKVDGAKRPQQRALQTAASTAMTTTASAPGAVWGSGPVSGSIPLKTRVMQYLAMGETSQENLCRRMGGDEQNVMRVVKVVGRPSQSQPRAWSLLPNQYYKIKLGAGQWSYTYAEQQEVIRLAHVAFDELGLPPNAEERLEFNKKEKEAQNGYGSRSSDGSEKGTPQLPSGTAVQMNAISHVREREKARTESPSPVTRSKPLKKGPQSKIAKERAKFLAERSRAGSGSLPNVKGVEGLASPRMGEMQSPSVSPEKKSVESQREREKDEPKGTGPMATKHATGDRMKDEPAKQPRAAVKEERPIDRGKGTDMSTPKLKRSHASYDYSSSSSLEANGPLRSRSDRKKASTRRRDGELSTAKVERSPREKPVPLSELVKLKEKRTRELKHSSSSDEEGELRGRPKGRASNEKIHSSKRRAPPMGLDLSQSDKNQHGQTREWGHSYAQHDSLSNRMSSTPSSDPSRLRSRLDPNTLRDRYEELHPAYNQLAHKLTQIYHQAEQGDDVDIAETELQRMVGKWEKWHQELADIRRYFGEA